MTWLVYVSGAPGAGKSTLAGPLAAELGYALVAKDRIKETLHDVLGGPDPDLAWSRQLGEAAMELLWALAADSAAVMLEANFRPYSSRERQKLKDLAERAVEVHCACPLDLAWARYNSRARHPIHVRNKLRRDEMDEFDRPVGVGELVEVDTSVPVDVPLVAKQVRRCLAG